MKIIFAQGNPGAQYTRTRHNVGFLSLETLAIEHTAEFNKKPKFYADIAELSIAGQKVLLVKPTTFYNETGQSARALVDFYKLDAREDLLVIHDELALPFGTIRIRQKGSDAGNNGIKSLNQHLGPDYARIRIGVSNDVRNQINDADFVLSPFTKQESDELTASVLPKVQELITQFCAGSLEMTSHSI